MPWALAHHDPRAERWLDESDVALHTPPLQTYSSVSADLHRTQQPALGPVNGQASVSAMLSMKQVFKGQPVAGAASAYALIGDVFDYGGSSSGSSQVSGSLLHGQVEMIAGASSGAASIEGYYALAPDLDIRRYSYISGGQVGADWGTGEDLPPSGSGGRSAGTPNGRRVFSPRASGRVSDRSAWQVPRAGTDAGGGE